MTWTRKKPLKQLLTDLHSKPQRFRIWENAGMEQSEPGSPEKTKWNRARIATAIVVSVGIPVAIDQAYFRYNVYILPVVGLVAALLYVGLVLTIPAVSERIHVFHRDFGPRHPWKCLLVVAGSGVVLFLLLGAGEWFAISKSKEHVAALRKADSPKPLQVPESNPNLTLEATKSTAELRPLNSPSRAKSDIAKRHDARAESATASNDQKLGGQSIGTLNCNAPGNCAGINNGQQTFVQNGEPPSIKQLIVNVQTSCILADQKKIPEAAVLSVPSENSYIGKLDGGKETLVDGAFSFSSASANGEIVATQKFALAQTSVLIGQATATLFRDYDRLHIVDTAVAGGYFKDCTFVSTDITVNGVSVMHEKYPVSAHMDNVHGLTFDIVLTPR